MRKKTCCDHFIALREARDHFTIFFSIIYPKFDILSKKWSVLSCHAYLEPHVQTKQLIQVTQGICFADLQQMDKPVFQPLKSVVTTN